MVWDGLYDPRAEIHPQLAGWFELLTGPDRATLTHTVSKTLSFTVEPFDVFTVDASLIVSASSKTDDEVGYVNAFNTFRAAFTGGDTSLLTAASASGAAPVSEPASAALVLSGLLWAASRRHINTRPITEPATPEACGSRPSRNG